MNTLKRKGARVARIHQMDIVSQAWGAAGVYNYTLTLAMGRTFREELAGAENKGP